MLKQFCISRRFPPGILRNIFICRLELTCNILLLGTEDLDLNINRKIFEIVHSYIESSRYLIAYEPDLLALIFNIALVVNACESVVLLEGVSHILSHTQPFSFE